MPTWPALPRPLPSRRLSPTVTLTAASPRPTWSVWLLAFGFHTVAIDGHDFDAIEKALNQAKTVKGQPTAIVMSTVKGKGVSYMENNAGWHGKAPNDAEYEQAMAELNAAMAELEGK